MRRLLKILVISVICGLLGNPVMIRATEPATNIAVEQFELANGMRFLVVERPAVPQISFRLAIRAGSALEETGQTGIAHLLEHMLFKGTKNFGSTDWHADQKLQGEIDAAYQVVKAEQAKRQPDLTLIAEQQETMAALRQKVQQIYQPQAFSSQLGKNGGVGINAFTTRDQTQYTVDLPSDMAEQWFSIVSEQLFEPSFREFYVEKEVIQREWAFRYVNNPNGAAWQDLYSLAFTAHPYRNPVIGWRDDMAGFDTQIAQVFHGRYYKPANAVAVLVGDITPAKVKELAQRYFERYPAGQRATEKVTQDPEQSGPRQTIRYFKGAKTPLVRIGFHGAAMGSDDFYALDALTLILSSGHSARMRQQIVNQGLAADAWAYNPDHRYGGLVVLGGTPLEPEMGQGADLTENQRRQRYLEACEKLADELLGQVEALKTALVSEAELKRIKKQNRRDFLERLRGNGDLAGTLATLEVESGWDYLNTYLDAMDRITAEDIQRVAQHYFEDTNRSTVFVVPGGAPDKPPEVYTEVRSVSGQAARQQVSQLNFTNHSEYPTPENWKHPLSFDRTPNKIIYPPAEQQKVGATPIYYLPDHQLPFVELTLMLPVGEVDLPEQKAGLTDLFSATLIKGGTATLTPPEMAQYLDENGIHLAVNVDEEMTTIGLSTLKEDWPAGMAVLKEVFSAPRFDANIINITKERMLTQLRRQSENAQAVAGREWARIHFEGHPYGRDSLAALETLPQIDTAMLTDFLETFFVPSQMIATVSGDISLEEANEAVADILSVLPGQTSPARTLEPPSETEPVLALVHKPGQMQSQVMMGLTGPVRTDPDYWKLNLLVDLFGGEDSMVYKRLRDDLGLVYSAGFFQPYRWQAGMVMGYIGCKGDQTAAAISETVKLMRDIRQSIPEDLFEINRQDALNSFVFNVDTPADLVNVYGRYALRGEPLNTLDQIQEQFISATPDDMSRLAKQWLDPAKLQMIVVADKTISVKDETGATITLEVALKNMAQNLNLAFKEVALR